MCLALCQEDTDKLRQKLEEHGYIWAYKVMREDNKSPIHQQEWFIGWNYSNRYSTTVLGEETLLNIVERGFYVIITKKLPIEWEPRVLEKVVKVKCHKEDFVACNGRIAVFTKVFVESLDPLRVNEEGVVQDESVT